MGCYMAMCLCYVVLCGAMWCYAARAGSITCYRKGGVPYGAICAIGAIYGYIPNVFFRDASRYDSDPWHVFLDDAHMPLDIIHSGDVHRLTRRAVEPDFLPWFWYDYISTWRQGRCAMHGTARLLFL